MSVRLSFHGAARTVTGSCLRIQTGAADILVDCGLFQGPKTEKELNYRPFPFAPAKLDAVILTHAHIDHSGQIPRLSRHGFRGPVLSTPATRDLAGVMLPDSGYIQELEVANLNRRNARRGGVPVSPIYTAADAQAAMRLFQARPYREWFPVAAGIRARFWNAGHLLGSASVEIELPGEAGAPLRLLVSGDVGPGSKLLHPDPEGPADVDYVVCESTYGDTDRPEATEDQRRRLLAAEVLAARAAGGALLIPSFAVERTQELLSDLVRLTDSGVIPAAPIYIDSPLATRATQVFEAHAAELEGGSDLVRALHSRSVHFTEDAEESKALDRLTEFHIVIAASGMCEAGRIRYRLKNWLWRDSATVLFTGFQAQGTLGRILQDGARAVRIQGDEITVRARIRSIDLYSGHADAPELARWVEARMPIRHQVFLVHGEQEAIEGLRGRLASLLRSGQVEVPSLDQGWALTAAGARPLTPAAEPRLPAEAMARLDWHNDLSRLILDLNATVHAAADERGRQAVIRRVRRALDEGTGS